MKIDIMGSVASGKTTLARALAEKYNSKPTFKFLLWNVKWVLEFEWNKREILQTVKKYGDRCKIFRNQEQVMDFVERMYGI